MANKFKPGFSSLFLIDKSIYFQVLSSLCCFLSGGFPPSPDRPKTDYFLLLEKELIVESFRLAMLFVYDRFNLTCELNPKLT